MSNGSAALLSPENGAGLSVVDVWKAHDYEVWTGAWDYWNTNIVYTGWYSLTYSHVSKLLIHA